MKYVALAVVLLFFATVCFIAYTGFVITLEGAGW